MLDITVIGEKPDGLKINDGVLGQSLSRTIVRIHKESGAAVGLVFDGDSDC